MEITKNIYKIIKNKMLVQSAVATRAGYDAKTFNNMLRGRKLILPEDIVRISKALEVTPNELFGYDEIA